MSTSQAERGGGFRAAARSFTALTAVVACLAVTRAQAVGPAVSFSSPGTLINNWSSTLDGFSLGWEFDVLKPVWVGRLGYFNYGPLGAGITTPHQVGIFDASGNLLVSATVNPGDPVQGWFAWKPLTSPFLLPVGTGYRIAATTGPLDLYTYSVSSITVDPDIAWVTNRYVRTPTSTLLFPTRTIGSYPGYHFFGPNFDIVPEPATVQLPLLLSFAALAWWRRNRR